MASGFEFFDRQLSVALAGMDPATMQKEFVAFANKSVADLVASGQASPQYDTFVNGHPGPIEAVVLPGPVVVVFSNWALVIKTAIEELQKRVPRKSGRYAASYVVLANQQPVTDFTQIPAGAELTIFNRQPYTRRLETKDAGRRTAKYFGAVKTALNSRFSGVFKAEVLFLNIVGGVADGVPYILKGSHGRRKDRQAGQPISYPALVIGPA